MLAPSRLLTHAALLLALLFALPSQAARPEVENELIYITDDGEFMIHYALEGKDALRHKDDVLPQNGLPDVIDNVVRGLQLGKRIYIEEEGWRKWEPDDDGMLDIFIVDIPSSMMAAGYATWEVTEDYRYAPYIVINKYLKPLDAEDTGLHELHHAIQFAYNPFMAIWMYEAQSTHAQFRLYGDRPEMLEQVEWRWGERLKKPEESLDTYNGFWEYTAFVWMKYIVDRNEADLSVLRDLWEEMVNVGSWKEGHENFFAKKGMGTFNEEFALYTQYNLFACGNKDGYHYTGSPPDCSGIQTRVTAKEIFKYPISQQTNVVKPLGASYIRLNPECSSKDFRVFFEGGDLGEAEWGVRAVGVPVDGEPPFSLQFFVDPEEDKLEFVIEEQARFKEIYLIAQNLAYRTSKSATFTIEAEGDIHEAGASAPGKLIIGLPGGRKENWAPGDRLRFAAKGVWGACDFYPDFTDKVIWRVSDEKIVRPVSTNGLFEILDYGSATVWAEYETVKSAGFELLIKKPVEENKTGDDDDGESEAPRPKGIDTDKPSESCSCRIR